MAKQSKAAANEAFLCMMLSKGNEVVFRSEMPHPETTARVGNILAVVGNQIYIRSAAA